MAGRVPELVMGSVQLGLTYGAANRTGMPSREAALRLVRRAVASDVGIFDTARAYGEAEVRLGEALANAPAYIVTKLSPLTGLVEGTPRTLVRAAVDDSIAQSCAALRRSSLDCLLLHRASHLVDFGGAVWERLLDHRKDGRVGRLGVSVQSPAEALAAAAHPEISHIQLPFNLLDWRWEEAGVPDALRARSITVHVRSVFLQGLLVAGDADLWPSMKGTDPRAIVAWIMDAVEELKRESAADLCLAFARAQDWIGGVVIGMETQTQLETNVALAGRAPLSAEACAWIVRTRPPVPAALLDPAQWHRA